MKKSSVYSTQNKNFLFVWKSEAEASKANWQGEFTQIILHNQQLDANLLTSSPNWGVTDNSLPGNKAWALFKSQSDVRQHKLKKKKLEMRTVVAIKELLQQMYSTAHVYKHLAFQRSPKMWEMRAHNKWHLAHDEQTYYMRPMLNKQWENTKQETWMQHISPWHFLIRCFSRGFPACFLFVCLFS